MQIIKRLLRAIAHRTGLIDFLRRQKQPRMVWGWRDASGNWLPKVRISDTAYLGHLSQIQLSDNVFIGHYTLLDGTGGITIGEGSQMAAWSGIITHGSHLAIRLYGSSYTEVAEDDKKAYPKKPVVIGRYVFIGAAAKILPGVTIGDGALISAGAIVHKDVPAYAIVSGNPAEIVGDVRTLDKRYLEMYPELRETYVFNESPMVPPECQK